MDNAKKFLFLIPRTPEPFRDEFRERLWEITQQSLRDQDYQHWEALVLDNHEADYGQIKHVNCPVTKKPEKLNFAIDYIKQHYSNPPDYIIRLDDDDVFSPIVLSQLSTMDFDCYGDKYQHFYDGLNNRFFSKKTNYLANTVVMKYGHAALPGENGLYLIAQNHHDYFMPYFAHKKLLYSNKATPLYIRVLSPNCLTITNRIKSNNGAEDDLANYKKLLKRVEEGSFMRFWWPWSVTWFKKYRSLIMQAKSTLSKN